MPFVEPMLATAGSLADVSGTAWVHEFKWDGVRAVACREAAGTRLWSRNGNDVTPAYPELALGSTLPEGTVLDGEIVATGADGAPSFSLLQRRMHVRDVGRARQLADEVSVTLMVFDVLVIGDEALFDQPFEERRRRLEALALDGPRLVVPPQGDDPAELLGVAEQHGLEGLVAKRRRSVYRPGVRSRDWRKVRIVHEQDCAVVGWRRGRRGRSGHLGALLLATWEGDHFQFAGAVGSGLRDADLRTWRDHLEALSRASAVVADPPTGEDLVWTEPAGVVRVRHRGWTPAGRLRQPSYVGIRTDVTPRGTGRQER